MSLYIFGELGYTFIEKPSRCSVHHETLVKMQRELSLFLSEVYVFPITVVMSYCNLLEDLQQYRFILLQCWRPEVQNQFHCIKSRYQQDWFLLEVLWENPFSCLFKLLETAWILWPVANFSLSSKASDVVSSYPFLFLVSVLTLLSDLLWQLPFPSNVNPYYYIWTI